MIQKKLKLSSELNQILKNCDEIWVAVALISDNGFKYIQENINKSAKQNYLVGIGLPTSPNVLRNLKDFEGNGIFRSKIYHKSNILFHPKVYLINNADKLTAFVGSGNCTDGGFDKNLELSVKTDDQYFCESLLIWFNNLSKFGTEITNELLHSYSILFNKRMERIAQDERDLKTIFIENDEPIKPLNISLKNQFFKEEDFAAFEGTKPWLMTEEANQERKNVKNKFYKLHDKIYSLIRKRKWNIYSHYIFDDTVSSAIHSQYTSSELSGMWLHYGRNKADIKVFGEKETPLDFMRLQVIIHKESIGIWNRIGKDLGSRIDRDYFKNKMRNDSIYRQEFYSIISKLPNDYFIRINEQIKYVREFTTEQLLTNFVLQDDLKFYFVIGIQFKPEDDAISENSIISTILKNFEHLYPTYELMKYNLKL